MVQHLVTLFGVIAVGMALGSIKIRGLSLSAAAVFFVALAAGHYKYVVPREFTELGLVLFVYSVGLQAGPRFFALLKLRGAAFLAVGVGSTLAGAATAFALARWLDLPAHLAAGMYCGASTCTPALAGVLDILRRNAPEFADAASVGYAAAYPFSVVGVVLTVQLMPWVLRRPAKDAAAAWQAEQTARTPPLEECAFRITNPNCAKMTIDELQALHVTRAVLCRVKHQGVIAAARPDTRLEMGDVVLAVGAPAELAKLEPLLGTVAAEPMYDPTGNVASELVAVSHRNAVGKALRELKLWERHGVAATRVRRDGIELSPHGDLILEPGDVLRLVGARRDMQAAAAEIGRQERRLDETSLIPFAAGLALGGLIGQIPVTLPGGLEVRLGLSGGVLLVALVLGHLGHIGPMRLYVPNAAKHFARELGLVIFLVGAGTGAGQALVPVLKQAGPTLLYAGAAVTMTMIVVAVGLMHLFMRWNLIYSAGALSACMTNPPGLAAANQMSETDAAQVGFASVYPVALMAKILLGSLLYVMLKAM